MPICICAFVSFFFFPLFSPFSFFLSCSVSFRPCLLLLQNFEILLITGRSVKEFVKACKKATGVDIKVEYLDRRPGDYAEVYSDPSKIMRELNWTARYTNLQESLEIAWKWQNSHLNGYGPPTTMG